MEVSTENSISGDVKKSPEKPDFTETGSIGRESGDSTAIKSEITLESDRETEEAKSPREDPTNPRKSEIKEILSSENPSSSRETSKISRRPSNEPQESSALCPDSPTREKSPEDVKSTDEPLKIPREDEETSTTLKESPEGHEDIEEPPAEDSTPEDSPNASRTLVDTSRSEFPERTIAEVTSGRSDTPEVVAEAENEAKRRLDEEDLENGQEDEEDEEEDDEIVEHEEECPINVEPPEVGIVGPPTAVRDLVNDEELGTTESSSLPSDTRNNETTASSPRPPDDVAEWIERSSRHTNDTDDENTKANGNNVGKTSRRREKSLNDLNNPSTGVGPTRKSQRIVTSIIRRSIKWYIYDTTIAKVSRNEGFDLKFWVYWCREYLKPEESLNKMHAAAEYGSGGGTSVKKLDTTDKREEDSRGSPKVPQSRQNGAALPEETATAMATSASASVNSERLRPMVKSEKNSDTETEGQSSAPNDRSRSRRRSIDEAHLADSRNSRKKSPTSAASSRGVVKTERDNPRKRRSTDDTLATSFGQQFAKKVCFEQRERFIDSLVGTNERITAEELATRADELRAEVQALDELARAKEMEWNEILSMRKLKEEAYLRIERRRQVIGYMESNGCQLSENLPPASLSLIPEWESTQAGTIGENSSRPACQDTSGASSRDVKETGDADVRLIETQESQRVEEETKRELSPVQTRREKASVPVKTSGNPQRRTASPKQLGENGRKQQQRNQQQQQHQQRHHHQQQQQLSEQQSLDNRQIGEGRQGPIVDVRSIIADYRLRHPETVPRRGRRMRNSVNIGLGAGGAMVETMGHTVDSRPSSTDSCKSTTGNNQNPGDPNNSMSFKDVLVQFAKLSQQQGEPVKTPQNYPDVTLHPVAPTTVTINSATSQQQQQNTGSLLHGILTKSQSPRPTTFSPTLARLLTAPERERTSAAAAAVAAAAATAQTTSVTAVPQQNIQTQHLLQTYQGSNPVSISDLLSSSKARTEITITPVVTPITPMHTSQSNSLIHVDDVEEDASLMDERDSRLGSGGRDNRDERDSPPRCQGCQERAAQFVCAGCGNQWYCSRDCQVAAWDEHSEVCSG